MNKITLKYTSNIPFVKLRPICGHDEESLAGIDTFSAVALIDHLLPNTDASTITAPDRDRILAYLCIDTFGDRIESTKTCENCREKFDLKFSLNAMLNDLQPSGKHLPETDSEGYFRVHDLEFRLPTGNDESEAATLPDPVQELLRRCVKTDCTSDEAERVQEAMESIAPQIDAELNAACPECGNEHLLRFDIQTWFLSALLQENALRAREIHCIAVRYGWGLNEILSLPRKRRKQFVSLIENGE